jgi:hypothetical protein
VTHDRIVDAGKNVLDGTAVGVAAATFFDWLPEATALLSFIWIAIRILETHTVRRLMGKEPLK